MAGRTSTRNISRFQFPGTMRACTVGALPGLLLAASGPALAATNTWQAGTADWFLGSSWSLHASPTASDDPVINNGGIARIQDPGAVANIIRLGNTAVHSGVLHILGGGSLSNWITAVGSSAGGIGAVSVDGAGSAWSMGSTLLVGSLGTGVLSITNGATVTDFAGIIGSVSGSGNIATVNGAGSTWINTNQLTIGRIGTGTLYIVNGGRVAASSVILGTNGGSIGTLNIGSGGMLVTGQLSRGAGAGTVNFDAGQLRLGADQAALFSGFSAGAITLNAGGATIDTNGFSAATAIPLGGVGSLSKLGAGMLTLTGANTYGGGTHLDAGILSIGSDANLGNASGALSFDGGTLQTTASFATGRATTLGAAGGGIDTPAGTTLTHAGLISGTGSLAKLGGGTLTLTGTNSYNGGTNIDAGVLSVGSDANLGNASGPLRFGGGTLQTTASFATGRATTLGAGGGGIDTLAGTTLTHAGLISGTGSLAKLGGGTLILTGANTYSGGTTIAGGALQLGDGGASGSVSGDIVNNAALAFNRSDTLTIGGSIAGSGSVTQMGSGATILTGANSYGGGTVIAAGRLVVNGSIVGDTLVNGGGGLGGSGTVGNVTVNAGGTIAPGNSTGILTVVGDLALMPGSTTVMEIDGPAAGSQRDQINVSGTVTLDGTLDLAFGYVPAGGTRINLINAGSLVLAGDPVNGFAAITSNLGVALKPQVVIDPTSFDILIELAQQKYLDVAGPLTRNQRQVARSLDSFATSGQADDLVAALNTLSAGQLPGAFDALSGEQLTFMPTLALRHAQQLHGLLARRLGGGHGDSLSAGRRLDSVKLAAAGDGWEQAVAGSGEIHPDRRFWMEGLGGVGDFDSTRNAAGADYRNGGLALGAELDLNERLSLGGAFSYLRADADVAHGDLDVDSYQAALYGRWAPADVYLRGSLGIGFHDGDADRRIAVGSFIQTARADEEAWSATAAVEGGRAFAVASTATLTPFAGLEYSYLDRDDFTEKGAGSASLRVKDETQQSLRSALGVRLERNAAMASGLRVRPMLEASWLHEFLDDHARFDARFASVTTGTGFAIDGPELDRDRLRLRIGLNAQLAERADLSIDYQGEVAPSDSHHAFGATLRMAW